MRTPSLAAIFVVACAIAAQAQFGGTPSPGSPATTTPSTRPATPPTAPGAPTMTPYPPRSNPTLPPGTPGSNVPPRNPIEPIVPAQVQPLPQPNTNFPTPSLPAPIAPGSTPAPTKDAFRVEGATQERQAKPLSSFAACMQLWDSTSKMTKREWASSCRDSEPPRGGTTSGYTAAGASTPRHVRRDRHGSGTVIYWREPRCD
jgi:hypothetical protein